MRLIDADELKNRLKEYCIDGDKEIEEYYEIMGIDDCVDKAPTVDAVEVVRCENCRYFVTNYAVPHCSRTLIGMKKSDFCSYGERREEQ